MTLDPPRERLRAVLSAHSTLALAVSGGVDSMTLAHAAHRFAPEIDMTVCHAVSPAVPAEATGRVKEHAARHGWKLLLVDAEELENENYRRNPVNRCYFCKSNLYERIGRMTRATIASGANLDDLGDYRPGLTAARENDVVHPFVDAGMTKADVRDLARRLGLDDISELPAQPCLASRVETGIAISPDDLAFVAATERHLRALAGRGDLRCRIVRGGVRIEIDPVLLDDAGRRSRIEAAARAACAEAGRTLMAVGAYRRGAAFLHDLAN